MTVNEARLARVQGAAKVALIQRMKEREQAIITRMVVAYRAGKATSESLFGGIAAIAELRSIVTEAEQDQLMAQREFDNITQGSQA